MALLKNSSRKYCQTILMVTHNESLACNCDRIFHIEDGMLLQKRETAAEAGSFLDAYSQEKKENERLAETEGCYSSGSRWRQGKAGGLR